MRRGDATADHVIPQSENGPDDESNIVAACEPCNRAKRSLPVRTFVRMLKGLERPTHFAIAVQGVLYRLEKRSRKAETNILALVGQP